MEEKNTKEYSSLRPVFSNWNIIKFFSAKFSKSAYLKNFLDKKGFTYVELLIVIAVIGIVTAGTLIAINPSFQLKKARDAHRKSDLKLVQSGLELYKADQGGYPDGATVGVIITAANCPPMLTDDDACTPPYTKIYIQDIPTDPKTGNNYYYYTGTPVNGYTLYSCLENVNDPDKLPVGSTNPAYPNNVVRTALACSVSAYYAVTSP